MSIELLSCIALFIFGNGSVIASIFSPSTKQDFLSSKNSGFIVFESSNIPKYGKNIPNPFLPFGKISMIPFAIFKPVILVTTFSNKF